MIQNTKRIARKVDAYIFSFPILRSYPRIFRYAMVGAVAAVVQLSIFTILVWLFPDLEVPMLLIAMECAIITGFFGHIIYTFRDRDRSLLRQFLQFQLISMTTVVGQTSLYWLIRTFLLAGEHIVLKVASSAIAILVMFLVNFTLNSLITFRKPTASRAPSSLSGTSDARR